MLSSCVTAGVHGHSYKFITNDIVSRDSSSCVLSAAIVYSRLASSSRTSLWGFYVIMASYHVLPSYKQTFSSVDGFTYSPEALEQSAVKISIFIMKRLALST